MTFANLRELFEQEYRGEINDPVLVSILQAVQAYQNEVQNKLLLSAYAKHSTNISDAFFEVLNRHLFGQMFPGPAYCILHATLRENIQPINIRHEHYFETQGRLSTGEERQVSFSPITPTWLIPSFKDNDVIVERSGNDLILNFPLQTKTLGTSDEPVVSVFIDTNNLFLIERLRCRLHEMGAGFENKTPNTNPFHLHYPSRVRLIKDFYHTPFEARTLNFPLTLLRKTLSGKGGNEIAKLTFTGLGEFAAELEQKIKMNTFVAWNMVEREDWLTIEKNSLGNTFHLPIRHGSHDTYCTIVSKVLQTDSEHTIQYFDASSLLDPAYPFQYTSMIDTNNDEIILTLSPIPQKGVEIRYFQYDLTPSATGIPKGKPFRVGDGIEEGVRTVQSVSEAQRLNFTQHKEVIWEYFRSMMASRNRWVTKDDLRAGIASFPPFSSIQSKINYESIDIRESVGRIPYLNDRKKPGVVPNTTDQKKVGQVGFLSPFTEIDITVQEPALLQNPESNYFRRKLADYIKQRTIHGNYFKINFVKEV